jgi:hypothetical protein
MASTYGQPPHFQSQFRHGKTFFHHEYAGNQPLTLIYPVLNPNLNLPHPSSGRGAGRWNFAPLPPENYPEIAGNKRKHGAF